MNVISAKLSRDKISEDLSKAIMLLKRKGLLWAKENGKILEGTGNPILSDIALLLFKDGEGVWARQYVKLSFPIATLKKNSNGMN